jgi:hypothetical protein
VTGSRDEFPNHYVGDLVPTERGWVVVPPTCRPDGHDYSDRGWSVSSDTYMARGRSHKAIADLLERAINDD